MVSNVHKGAVCLGCFFDNFHIPGQTLTHLYGNLATNNDGIVARIRQHVLDDHPLGTREAATKLRLEDSLGRIHVFQKQMNRLLVSNPLVVYH